jgi:hypothetical protein
MGKTPDHLTVEEKELILATKESGEILELSSEQTGKWVAGAKDFIDNSDPSFAVRYLEARDSLVRKGFLKHDSGNVHKLTSLGFETKKIY